jgi:hypothetical protein
MTRPVWEGSDPKVTVALNSVTYRSTGPLQAVMPGYRTRAGRVYTLLLIDRGWMYADAYAADRAWGFINQSVTVTWRLAYGRRYVVTFDGTGIKKG